MKSAEAVIDAIDYIQLGPVTSGKATQALAVPTVLQRRSATYRVRHMQSTSVHVSPFCHPTTFYFGAFAGGTKWK